MSSVHNGLGAALDNAAGELLRMGECLGPASLVVNNQGSNDVVIRVEKESDETTLATDKDTAVADEDTVYNGDTSELSFSGEALNNVPIIPGTVTVKPPAGGTTVNATDKDKDGKLYTDDVDLDECGSIDYFTGDLVLEYPAGKAPNTGDIDCDYSHQGSPVVPGGIRTFTVLNNPPSENLVIKGAANGGSSFVKVDGLISF